MTTQASLRTFLLLTAGSLLAVSSAQAQLTWDANNTTAITATDDVNFGTATAGYTGTVTISGTQTANSITIGAASGGVTISGGTAFNLGNADTILTQNSASNATFGTVIGGGTNGLTKAGSGRLILNGATNTYTGKTLISGGILRFGTTWSNTWTGVSLNANSNLELNGGIAEAYYYLTRTLGSANAQIQLTGGRSGFTNLQGDASANFMTFTNTSTTVTWGSATFDPSTLVLNDTGASCVLRMPNPFDLNGAARTIEVSATGAGAGRGTYGTMEGILSGAGGSLAKTGGGTLLLNGANTYDGGTSIDGGALWFHRTAAMPNSGGVSVNDGGMLAVSVGGANQWTTGTSGNGTIGGLLAGLGGQTGGTVSYAGSVGLGLYVTGTQTFAGDIGDLGTSLSLHVGNKDAGTASDPFTQNGTLVLSGTNSYTGLTRVNSGNTLRFATQNSLYSNTEASWTAENLNVKSGATLAFNVGGAGEFDTGNVTTLLTNLGTSSGPTNGMNSGAVLGFDTTNASGGTFTIADTITNITGAAGSNRNIAKLGAGTLVLSGPNTYTGTTTVSAGTLSAGVAAVAGVSGPFGLNNAISLANVAGATLDLNGFDTRIGSLTGGGTTGGAVALNGGAILTVGTNNTNATFAGNITGDGHLVKTGTATQSFTGTLSFTGTATASQGVMDFASANINSMGGGATSRDITVAPASSGAAVRFNNLTNAQLNRIVETTDEITVMSGTTASGEVDFSSSTGANLPNAFLGNWAGNGAKAEYNVTITPASDNYRLGGRLSSGLLGIRSVLSGSQGLIVGGTGATGIRVDLVAANTFTGDTVINTGARLTLGNNLALQNSALNVGSAGGNFSLAAGTNGGKITGETAAPSPTFGGLKGSRNLISVFSNAAGNNETNLAATAVTGFTLNVAIGMTHTYSGAIGGFGSGASGGLNGNSTLTKTGLGTQTLSGANTYTGNTTVGQGTLALVGGSQKSAITVDSGASLGFTLGSPTTSTSSVDLTNGTVKIDGMVDNSSDYLLITASTITGTPTLDSPIAGYTLQKAAGDTELKLVYIGGGGTPEIAVEQPALTDIANGASKDFGTVTLGSNTSLEFTIRNSGTAALNLTGSPLVAVSEADMADFTVTATPTTPVASGGTTTFTVQFAPGAAGVRNATLTIANDDLDEGTFTINISGTGQTAYEAWSGGAGFGADANDDGVPNGLAFLLGASGPNVSALDKLPSVSQSGGNLTLTFQCLNAASRGSAVLNLEHSGDLGISDPWTTVAVPDSTPGGPSGGVTFTVGVASTTLNNVTATISNTEAASGRLFGRFKATE
jgi:fibronectin-binding autotransporter adhesin